MIGMKLSSAPNVIFPVAYVSVRAFGSFFLLLQEDSMPNVSIDAMKIMSDDARYFIVWANIKKILFGLVFGASMQTP
jgi:hypothetical protein